MVCYVQLHVDSSTTGRGVEELAYLPPYETSDCADITDSSATSTSSTILPADSPSIDYPNTPSLFSASGTNSLPSATVTAVTVTATSISTVTDYVPSSSSQLPFSVSTATTSTSSHSSSSGTSASSEAHKSISDGTIVAIAASTAIVVVIVVAASIYYIFRRRFREPRGTPSNRDDDIVNTERGTPIAGSTIAIEPWSRASPEMREESNPGSVIRICPLSQQDGSLVPQRSSFRSYPESSDTMRTHVD
ncbi:hypothetical protein C8Q74DRAFT_1282183 [Fomes fomentarius]|nr:hypothetical protein C8Q74DRAFT_1282183 [Fomes fomentarius]